MRLNVVLLEVVLDEAGRQERPVFTLALDQPLLIGRSTECQIILADSHVSRQHCRLTPSPYGAVLQVLSASNSVWVGTEELPSGTSHTLAPGQRVSIPPGFVVVLEELAEVSVSPEPPPPLVQSEPLLPVLTYNHTEAILAEMVASMPAQTSPEWTMVKRVGEWLLQELEPQRVAAQAEPGLLYTQRCWNAYAERHAQLCVLLDSVLRQAPGEAGLPPVQPER